MVTTLTLNPAFDVHVSISDFVLYKENLATSVIRDVGGKGINISRALTENGTDNTALIICGKENKDEFTEGLKNSGVTEFKTVECDGRIRENITIHPENGIETRLSFKGFNCNKTHLDKIYSLIENSEYVTFTGSLPPGISADDTLDFLLKLKQQSIKLIIDSKSISLDMLKTIKPWLIKPNEEEIFDYTGISDENALFDVANRLNIDGIENVLISLGKNGAILASDGALFSATVPEIKAISTIGAGDSTIAGFISASGLPEDRLKTAMAFGCAACMRHGTNPPLKNDIDKILNQVKVTKRLSHYGMYP